MCSSVTRRRPKSFVEVKLSTTGTTQSELRCVERKYAARDRYRNKNLRRAQISAVLGLKTIVLLLEARGSPAEMGLINVTLPNEASNDACKESSIL